MTAAREALWRRPSSFPVVANVMGLGVEIALVAADDPAIRGADAAWCPASRTISVNRELPARRRWYYLLHETVHVAHDLLDEALRTGEVRAR